MSTIVTAIARLRRPAAFVVTLAVCAIAIPASASAFYGSASGSEQGSVPATASNDSSLVIPDHLPARVAGTARRCVESGWHRAADADARDRAFADRRWIRLG